MICIDLVLIVFIFFLDDVLKVIKCVIWVVIYGGKEL